MTIRFSLFSHVERLGDGGLELESPFGADAVRLCRYALHRQDESVLRPDPDYVGMAAYHRLLPLAKDTLPTDCSLFCWSEAPPDFAGELASLRHARFNPQLLFAASLPMAQQQAPTSPVFCRGPAWEREALAKAVAQHPVALATPDHPDALDLSAWQHPYRLEGLKLLGFALAATTGEQPPTIVVPDATGEVVFALTLASQMLRHFQPDHLPFRLVLVQNQPDDHLCRAFERGGFTADEDDQASGGLTPAPVPQLLAADIAHHLGTALAMPDDNLSPSQQEHAVLTRLLRTGFVDDSDHVIILQPARENRPALPRTLPGK